VSAALLVASGDRVARTLPPPGLGIDPFEVLDLQVKPNVLFILDTSGSMQEDSSVTGGQFISGDDTAAKMYQAKKAINNVLTANAGRFNFGFASYNVLNAEKVLTDAPLTYVTTTAVPGALIWSGGNSYFSTAPGTPYLATSDTSAAADAQVWRSFARTTLTFPGPGCAGSSCRVHLRSRLFRTGLKFKWSTTATGAAGQAAGVGTSNILTAITSINCANFPPPAGLFPDDPAGLVRPCIQHENSAVGGSSRTTTFWYAGARFDPGANGTANCGGAAVLDNVARCDVNNVSQIQRRLQLEFPLWDLTNPGAATNTCGGPRGTPCALQAADLGTATAIVGTNPALTAGLDPALLGVASAQRTPLGGTLRDVFNSFGTTFPLPGGGFDGLQRHFVVLLTDGAETCDTNAVDYAGRLWSRNGHAAGQYAETFVVGFSLSAADQATLNAIACAGSGGTVSSCGTTTCACTGGSRMTALSATDAGTLTDRINGILASITAEGKFSSTPSVFDAIPEYVDTVPTPAGRVAAPPSQFKMWAVHDEGSVPGTVVDGFPVAFPAPGVGQGPYRGTLQPVTAYQGSEGVVFFVGTRFNPIAAGRCVSSFDSIVFGLFAEDASAAYDTLEFSGVKIVGLPVPPIDKGDGRVPADTASPRVGESELQPPPVPESGPGGPAVVVARTLRPSSSVCRF
jgi:hypothetical protein